MKKFMIFLPLLLSACTYEISRPATVVCRDGTSYIGYVTYDFDEISIYSQTKLGQRVVTVPRNSCYIQEKS